MLQENRLSFGEASPPSEGNKIDNFLKVNQVNLFKARESSSPKQSESANLSSNQPFERARDDFTESNAEEVGDSSRPVSQGINE